jgi:hypothetical protein
MLCTGHQLFEINRRSWLRVAGLGAGAWLTRLGERLAHANEQKTRQTPKKAVILLWMAGGPSQLETWDPQPGRVIGGPTKAIPTSIRGVQLAHGLEQTAEIANRMTIVRSTQSAEGDHERGTYAVKTGYRPSPAAVHPALGAIVCHQFADKEVDLPRHISIFPGPWPGRGGFLGDEFDAFKTFDPKDPIPDVRAPVADERMERRMNDLQFLEQQFANKRTRQAQQTRNAETIAAARKMMTTPQLAAFDLNQESNELRQAYGNTPFGRGCLAARRLVQQGVRCVEVTLAGWDTHANNFEGCRSQLATFDPAFATLIQDLERQQMLDHTLVVVAGEFGRTPKINALDGRDHWPHAFSVVLAGAQIKRGSVYGATDPNGQKEVEKPVKLGELHATMLSALGLDPARELYSPFGQPIKLAEGQPVAELLKS